MSCKAWAYCCVARSGMGAAASSVSAADPAAAAAAAAAPAAEIFVDAAPAVGVPAVGVSAAAGPADAAAGAARVSTGAAACAAGFGGALWQAASSASAPALTNRFDQLLTDFHLAVPAWIELRERSEALLHPLIVGALLGPRGVDFMQFDRLLLER